MTQRLSNRKSPSANSENCVTEEKDYRPKAIRLKEQNDKYEADKQFLVIRPDKRTVFYKCIRKGVRVPKDAEIHKGRI